MKKQRVIRAGAIELVDPEGRVRLVLAAALGGQPALALYDRGGVLRATLYLGEREEPSLILGSQMMLYVDSNGVPQIRLDGGGQAVLNPGLLSLGDEARRISFAPQDVPPPVRDASNLG